MQIETPATWSRVCILKSISQYSRSVQTLIKTLVKVHYSISSLFGVRLYWTGCCFVLHVFSPLVSYLFMKVLKKEKKKKKRPLTNPTTIGYIWAVLIGLWNGPGPNLLLTVKTGWDLPTIGHVCHVQSTNFQLAPFLADYKLMYHNDILINLLYILIF